MPKCLECGNTETFILTYLSYEAVTYKYGEVFDRCWGEPERGDSRHYLPECSECSSKNIEGEIK